MKQTLTLLICLCGLAAQAQVPYIQWKKCYGGSSLDNGLTIVNTSDSGYIVAGTSGSADGDATHNKGLYDCWVVKVNSSGTIMWQKSYGGSVSENCNFIQQTTDGGYIFAASSRSNDSDLTGNYGGYDYWIVKLDSIGNIIWQKNMGGSGFEALHCIRQTADGGYIAVGRAGSNDFDVTGNHGGDDVWVVKLNSSGGVQWKKCYGGTGDDDAAAVWQSYDGQYIVAGNTTSNDGDVSGNHGSMDVWVLKIDTSGALVWQKCYGGTGVEQMIEDSGAGGMQETSDSGIILASWCNSNDGDVTGNHGGFDFWVVKLTHTGTLVWQKSYGGTDNDEPACLQQTSDTGYIIAGSTYSNDGDVSGNHGGYDFWVIKVSPSGTLQWQKCMGGTGASPGDCANGIVLAPGGGYTLAGHTNANDFDVSGNHGDFDFWVVKLNCTMPSVGAITGPSAVCVGSTITLADTAAGGGWHSQNSNATVSGGTVTGVSAGADIITYNLTNTCGNDLAIHTVTVNPLPVPTVTVSGSVVSTPAIYVTYQWLHGSTTITGATNASYTVTASGSYSVRVTDANGCTGTSAPLNVVPIGVPSTAMPEIKVLPNPATDIIYVSGADNVSISVYSTTGSLLRYVAGTDHITITDMPPGLYFLHVTDEHGLLLKQEKVVKL